MYANHDSEFMDMARLSAFMDVKEDILNSLRNLNYDVGAALKELSLANSFFGVSPEFYGKTQLALDFMIQKREDLGMGSVPLYYQMGEELVSSDRVVHIPVIEIGMC